MTVFHYKAKGEAHRRRQAELAAQGERAYRAAFARLGLTPPTHDFGPAMVVSSMAGTRDGRAIGVPVPGMADYYAERRGAALAVCAKLSRSTRA
jgi:hypothetical protein